jgi:ferredoxin-NADP reductase
MGDLDTGAAAPPPVAPRLPWREARIEAIRQHTPRVKGFVLRPEGWAGFVAGQHVDVRLTAPDGYVAERSYSIASAPEEPERIELVIERLRDGEVSPFFHEVVVPGDTIEMRGPIGGHFVWSANDGGPLLLVAGGSGIAPLMAMLRHRGAAAPEVPTALIYSARTAADVIFATELMERAEEEPNFSVFLTLSRESGSLPGARAGRIDAGLVEAANTSLGAPPRRVYVCGSNGFVKAASGLLLAAGVPFRMIRTERFGGAPA